MYNQSSKLRQRGRPFAVMQAAVCLCEWRISCLTVASRVASALYSRGRNAHGQTACCNSFLQAYVHFVTGPRLRRLRGCGCGGLLAGALRTSVDVAFHYAPVIARTTPTFPRAAGQAGSGQQDVSYCYLGRDDSQLPDEAMMQYVTSAYSPFQSVFM